MKSVLLQQIERDRDRIVSFVSNFVRAASPNPPGDTRAAMALVLALLDQEQVPYKVVSRDDAMPNLVAYAGNSNSDRHLVLNGHIDVFPVESEAGWTTSPWSGEIRDKKIFGRGAVDMKAGTAASLFAFLYLRRLQNLNGKLTLALVSDEETLGPNGTNYLFEVCPEEITGTACLIGEPSSLHTVRFAQKGLAWVRFHVSTSGGHGGYRTSANAIDLAFQLIIDLRKFTEMQFDEPDEFLAALEGSTTQFELANGRDSASLMRSILMSVGNIKGGSSVNMVPASCEFEVDFRLPVGVIVQDLMAFLEGLRRRHNFTYQLLVAAEPNWCAPDGELAQLVKRNAHLITGVAPASVIGLATNDSRLWRYRGIPAVVYGPSPATMASVNENVSIDELMDVIKVHTLSAYDYLWSAS
jgi:succinyl-diaminopimelate desuccinylase